MMIIHSSIGQSSIAIRLETRKHKIANGTAGLNNLSKIKHLSLNVKDFHDKQEIIALCDDVI